MISHSPKMLMHYRARASALVAGFNSYGRIAVCFRLRTLPRRKNWEKSTWICASDLLSLQLALRLVHNYKLRNRKIVKYIFCTVTYFRDWTTSWKPSAWMLCLKGLSTDTKMTISFLLSPKFSLKPKRNYSKEWKIDLAKYCFIRLFYPINTA